MAPNLYVHFPFCRRKCTYCALHSRVGASAPARSDYAAALARTVADEFGEGRFSTVYFGGGSPALCDLRPLFGALAPRLAPDCEFTVELHPLDVTDDLLAFLRDGGVNRISMGVQSLDAATLADMGRGYTPDEAARAFAAVKRVFDNAGIDLILGYPGDPCRGWERLADWGLRHCSVYSLQLEPKTVLWNRVNAPAGSLTLPGDDAVLDRLGEAAAFLSGLGLVRYEISNYAQEGYACRHNLAVWRGEDYVGLGEGAFGRLGLRRTENFGSPVDSPFAPRVTEVTPEEDLRERTLFRLRTREGLDAAGFPAWRPILERFAEEGLLVQTSSTGYRLTARGTEICDTVLAELV